MRTVAPKPDGYDAFISYSQRYDTPIAQALQSEMQRFGRPFWKPQTLRVFRDVTGLAAAPLIKAEIERALTGSAWFVLMASPKSAESAWVNWELRWWLDHRSPDTLLIAWTDGEIVWRGDDFDWTVTDALPSCSPASWPASRAGSTSARCAPPRSPPRTSRSVTWSPSSWRRSAAYPRRN
ncbi:toll/interleukin-1 receptor domain-containing protein [Paractinoplanes durhamensis]|uniref:toll/interleukin-1 receptor domain-containing protein n=1 Tax=Paractinoplanes durhamensis TaxID=113563 RepID=UPI0036379F13